MRGGKLLAAGRGADADLDVGQRLQLAAGARWQIDRPAGPLEHVLAPADLDRRAALDDRARLARQHDQAALAAFRLPVQVLALGAAIDLEADIFPARALRRDRQRRGRHCPASSL